MNSRFFAIAVTAIGLLATPLIAGNGVFVQPLVLQGEQLEPGVFVTSIESIDVNDRLEWIVELRTDQSAEFDRVVMLPDGIRYRKGFGFDEPAGGLISAFDSVRINGRADIGWNLFFIGSLPNDVDSGLFFNDTLLIQKGDATTAREGLTPGTPYIGFFETRMNDDNRMLLVATVNDPKISGSVNRVLVSIDYDVTTGTFVETVLAKASDILPGQTEAIVDFGTGTHNQALNNAGQALYVATLTGPTATNAAIYRDLTLIRQKGDESPIAGRTFTNIGANTRLDMNDAGNWAFIGNISGDTADNQIVVSDDRIVAQRGTTAPGTDATIDNFGSAAPVRIDRNGQVWWFANLTGDTTASAAIFRCDAPVIRTGVEYDGLVFTTLASQNATVSGITKGYSISPSGQHLIFRGVLDDGRQGAFVASFFVPEPPCVKSPDLNGDGVVDGADLGILLSAWGDCPSSDCPADLNCDGSVVGFDLGTLLNSWGPLPAVCGSAFVGACCAPNGTPSCDNLACCEAVCSLQPFCCSTAWDSLCASVAKTIAACDCPPPCPPR